MTKTGQVVSFTTVHYLPEVDQHKYEIKEDMDSFNEHISVILLIYNFIVNKDENGFFLNDDEEAEAEDSNGFEFATKYAKDIDESTPDAYDQLIGAEIIIPHYDKDIQVTVSKRIRYEDGIPIGVSHNNPLLDTI